MSTELQVIELIEQAKQYCQNKQYGQAIACYEQALALNPQDTKALHGLGTIYRVQKQFDQAISCLKKY